MTSAFECELNNIEAQLQTQKDKDISEFLDLIEDYKDNIKHLLQADTTACNILLDSISI